MFWTPILLRQAEARRGLRRSLPHFKIDCLIQVTLRIGKGITYKGLSRCQCNQHHLCRPYVIILTHPVRAKIRIKYSQLGLDLPCQIPGLQLLKLQAKHGNISRTVPPAHSSILTSLVCLHKFSISPHHHFHRFSPLRVNEHLYVNEGGSLDITPIL